MDEMVREICQENQVNLEILSEGWLKILTKNGVSRRILGYKYDLNSTAASGIANDKYATYEMMKLANLPVIEHTLCYAPEVQAEYAKGRNSAEFIERYLQEHQNDIILKPNAGFGGKGVRRIRQKSEIPEAMADVFRWGALASLNPFYDLVQEYRVVMLDGQAKLVYGKARLDEKSEDFRFNLSAGAKVVDVADNKCKKLIDLAKKAVEAIGLRFCAVDIVEVAQTRELMIIEINSGVTISKYLKQRPEEYEKVKNIYKEAILTMFADADIDKF